MARFEHKVYRVWVAFSGSDYYLQAMVNKDWVNSDELGENGWEFVSFIPNYEFFLEDFPNPLEGIRHEFIRFAVFKRQIPEGEDMGWGQTRPKP